MSGGNVSEEGRRGGNEWEEEEERKAEKRSGREGKRFVPIQKHVNLYLHYFKGLLFK